jgi:Uma2 family endonuclease
MSVLATPSMTGLPGGPAIPNDFIWRLSVNQYHDMIRAGILTEDDPVELLEGWLVFKMPKKPLHRLVTQALRDFLDGLLPAGWHINVQEPVTTATSEPEPDISMVRGKRHDYKDRHPGPTDLGLVVEVSEATLERDQGWKKKMYAQARIAVYWVVNLVDRCVDVYLEPTGPGEEPDYRVQRRYGLTDEVPFSLENQLYGTVVLENLLNG